MISRKIAMVAAIALTVFGVATSSASAQRIVNNSTGVTLANGTVIKAGPSTATLTTNVGTITCQLSMRAVVTSPSTATVTGATAGTPGLTWTGCTDTIPLLTVCAVNTVSTSISATVTGAWTNPPDPRPSGGSVSLANTVVDVVLCGGAGTCRYSATVTATANNAANSLTVSQNVALLSGPGICPTNGVFNVVLTPVWVDANNNNILDAGEVRVGIRP